MLRLMDRIAQVLPKLDYTAYDARRIGWDKIAHGCVDSLRLPIYSACIYSACMLNEPFVAELAQAMAQRMVDTIKAMHQT